MAAAEPQAILYSERKRVPMKKIEIPVHEKYMLTFEEASRYFNIGENRLRSFAGEHEGENWMFKKGSQTLIKRKQFEKLIDNISTF